MLVKSKFSVRLTVLCWFIRCLGWVVRCSELMGSCMWFDSMYKLV